MRGRKPKPTLLKIISGNPGKRRLNKSEPSAPPAEAAPPKGLSKRARKIWNQLAPQMIASGLLTKLDSQAFVMLCQTTALYEEANIKIARHGMATVFRGSLRRSPYLEIANRAMRDVLRIMAEFGLTPSSRGRINIDMRLAPRDPDPDDHARDKRFFGA